jgi:hypothetical protein
MAEGKEADPFTHVTFIIILPVKGSYSCTLPWKNFVWSVVEDTITEFPGIYDNPWPITRVSTPPTQTPELPGPGIEAHSFMVCDIYKLPDGPVSPFIPT